MGDTTSMKHTVTMSHYSIPLGAIITSERIEDYIKNGEWDKMQKDFDESSRKLLKMIKDKYTN